MFDHTIFFEDGHLEAKDADIAHGGWRLSPRFFLFFLDLFKGIYSFSFDYIKGFWPSKKLFGTKTTLFFGFGVPLRHRSRRLALGRGSWISIREVSLFCLVVLTWGTLLTIKNLWFLLPNNQVFWR